MKQVFVSHTKKDKEFCDAFDSVCARVGIKAFRSEFEEVLTPAWKTIKDAMNRSVALFFLVGKELVNGQDRGNPKWRYTQNWIAYEMGLACQCEIDVWAICDDMLINFPMPYINDYLTVSLRHRYAFDYLRGVLEEYKNGDTYPFPGKKEAHCPYGDCKMGFNLHVQLQPGDIIKCPQCLRDIVFPNGHLISRG